MADKDSLYWRAGKYRGGWGQNSRNSFSDSVAPLSSPMVGGTVGSPILLVNLRSWNGLKVVAFVGGLEFGLIFKAEFKFLGLQLAGACTLLGSDAGTRLCMLTDPLDFG